MVAPLWKSTWKFLQKCLKNRCDDLSHQERHSCCKNVFTMKTDDQTIICNNDNNQHILEKDVVGPIVQILTFKVANDGFLLVPSQKYHRFFVSLNQITSSHAASSYKYIAEFMLETQPQRILRITSVQSQVWFYNQGFFLFLFFCFCFFVFVLFCFVCLFVCFCFCFWFVFCCCFGGF